ncbi:MAG: single-stranded DNA-binding protein [Methylococcaceae bacterium]
MSNVFAFTGACGRDAEVRYSAAGLAILSVTVANNVGFGDKQQTLWIRVTLFGKRAESSLKDYLLKGQQVFVSGELTLNEYKANDGTMKTSLELNANIIDLIGKRNDNAQGAMPQATNRARPATQPTAASADNFDAPYDDDIPF